MSSQMASNWHNKSINTPNFQNSVVMEYNPRQNNKVKTHIAKLLDTEGQQQQQPNDGQ